jgi:hypothetical protein
MYYFASIECIHFDENQIDSSLTLRYTQRPVPSFERSGNEGGLECCLQQLQYKVTYFFLYNFHSPIMDIKSHTMLTKAEGYASTYSV